MKKHIQAVFLDRDGTLGGDGCFTHPNNFQLYSFTEDALRLLKNEGIKKFAFTNQYKIASGEITIKEFEDEFKALGFHKAYICPHKIGEKCSCQKPKPGMLLRAKEEFNLELSKCAVIGDLGSDMLAANEVGALKILVKTGFGKSSLEDYRHTWAEAEADYIAENILDAVKWMLEIE